MNGKITNQITTSSNVPPISVIDQLPGRKSPATLASSENTYMLLATLFYELCNVQMFKRVFGFQNSTWPFENLEPFMHVIMSVLVRLGLVRIISISSGSFTTRELREYLMTYMQLTPTFILPIPNIPQICRHFFDSLQNM